MRGPDGDLQAGAEAEDAAVEEGMVQRAQRDRVGQVVGAVLAVPAHVRGFDGDGVAAGPAVESAHRAPVGVRAQHMPLSWTRHVGMTGPYPVPPRVGRTGRGWAAPKRRIRLDDAAAPTRLAIKGGITAGQRGGLGKARCRSLPKPGNGRDGRPKLITKYS